LLAACGGEDQKPDTPIPEPTLVPKATPTSVSETVVDSTEKTQSSTMNSSGANWDHLSAAERYSRISPPNSVVQMDQVLGLLLEQTIWIGLNLPCCSLAC